jgi:hypothetical protein
MISANDKFDKPGSLFQNRIQNKKERLTQLEELSF